MTTDALEQEITEAEAQWNGEGPVPVEIKEELPETSLVVKASNVFETQLVPIDAIIKRRQELGVVHADKCTREQRPAMQTINGLCRKANGDTDRVSDALKEEALKVQRVVNNLKKARKERISAIQKPILEKFGEWENEDAEIERQKVLAEEAVKREAEEAIKRAEEAERQRLLALENARLAAQAEANRVEQARLLKERWVLEEERKKAEQERAAADARVAAKMAEEKRQLDAALDARLAKERADFEERQKAEREKLEAKRLADKADMDRIQAELAEFRAQKAAADAVAEAKRLADEHFAKLEAKRKADELAAAHQRARLDRLAPDKERLKAYGDNVINFIAAAPSVTSPEAQGLMQVVIADLKKLSDMLKSFSAPG